MEVEPCYTIILFGKTGHGKSSVCNTLYGKSGQFKESEELSSCTKEWSSIEGNLFGKQNLPRIKIIDTPGFMDSTGDDTNTLESIY